MVRLSICNNFKISKQYATIQRPDFFNVTVNRKFARLEKVLLTSEILEHFTRNVSTIFRRFLLLFATLKKIYAPAVAFRPMA